jgi:hypothetical protein
MRRRIILISLSLACLAAAVATLAWHLRPRPAPTTAEQVVEAVMTSDPTEMSGAQLDTWIREIAVKAERLPPHEMQKLVASAMGNEKLRERFESLSIEQRLKLMNLVSEEQRAQMGVKFASGIAAALRILPAAARKVALQHMLARRDADMASAKGKEMEMSKDRVAQWLGATTPTQRAEMVRAMRDIQQMMKEAGVKE